MVYYIGWAVAAGERERLLILFAPVYPDVVADHVTLCYDVPADAPLPTERSGQIVGMASGDGVQALVVSIAGTIERPDGSSFHITWSLDGAAGRVPADSNTLIRRRGFVVVEPMTLALVPKLFG